MPAKMRSRKEVVAISRQRAQESEKMIENLKHLETQRRTRMRR